MEKQTITATEWLFKQLLNSEPNILEWNKLLDQAKKIEKQQIINCYNQSWHFRDKPYEAAEKYYNETFGK